MYQLVATVSKKWDIVLLLDGKFIRKITNELDIGEDKVLIVVVQYNDDTTIYFNLKTYTSK